MPQGRPDGCRLTPQARADLDDIWTYTARTWSPGQADRYIAGLAAASGLILPIRNWRRNAPNSTRRSAFTATARISSSTASPGILRWITRPIICSSSGRRRSGGTGGASSIP